MKLQGQEERGVVERTACGEREICRHQVYLGQGA